MALSNEQLIEELSAKPVMEIVALVKALEAEPHRIDRTPRPS